MKIKINPKLEYYRLTTKYRFDKPLDLIIVKGIIVDTSVGKTNWTVSLSIENIKRIVELDNMKNGYNLVKLEL